jgi:hypothetical protein
MTFVTTPSRWRVYQFHHDGNFCGLIAQNFIIAAHPLQHYPHPQQQKIAPEAPQNLFAL